MDGEKKMKRLSLFSIVSLFIIFFVMLISISLIGSGTVVTSYEGFALDSNENLYLGEYSKINVYKEDSLLYSVDAHTSRAYAMIAVRIKTPKGRKEITPKRIYVIDNNLICISDKQTESRGVELVKTAYDYGEFYFLSFPMGKKSGNFVCQKDLLTQGTLEEFEKLFDGKIVRKY